MKSQKISSNLMLLTTAMIWGGAFVAQSVGMNYIGPITFVVVRSLLGGIVLIPCILWLKRKDRPSQLASTRAAEKKLLLWSGLCCGFALCIASLFQQYGVMYTTVGKAGFISTLYILFVPLIAMFFGKKSPKLLWVSVGLAVIGMYFLCGTETMSINKGDLLVLICALCFSGHILLIDYFSSRVDCLKLSCLQLFFCAFFGSILMFICEKPTFTTIIAAAIPLLYAGVLSCGIAYTLQILGQKHSDPSVASLLLSLESVVAVLAGWILLDQTISLREFGGCVLVFAAILLAQLPDSLRIKKHHIRAFPEI